MTTRVDVEPAFSLHDYSEYHQPEIADPRHPVVVRTGEYQHVGVHPQSFEYEDNSLHISDHTNEQPPYTEVSYGHMGSVGTPLIISAGTTVDSTTEPALRGVRITVSTP